MTVFFFDSNITFQTTIFLRYSSTSRILYQVPDTWTIISSQIRPSDLHLRDWEVSHHFRMLDDQHCNIFDCLLASIYERTSEHAMAKRVAFFCTFTGRNCSMYTWIDETEMHVGMNATTAMGGQGLISRK